MRTAAPSIRSRDVNRRTHVTARSIFPGGSYDGGRSDLREFADWSPLAGGPLSDSLGDLPQLRARARDLARNAPIATSAKQTTVLGVVGSGLSLQPRIDRAFLKLDDAAASAFEAQAQRLWWAFAYGTPCDIQRQQTFDIATRTALASAWENGDMFVVRRYVKRPRDVVGIKLQLIEADRCSTPDGLDFDPRYADGVERDAAGEISAFHFSSQHPGERLFGQGFIRKWTRVPAFDAYGERNVLHVHNPVTEQRIGALRGIPALAPAMRIFKQSDRYTNAEIMAAVVAAMFTVFVKKAPGGVGENTLSPLTTTGTATGDENVPSSQYRLDTGAIFELLEGQSIETANPGRPNANFAPFLMAMLEQVGTSLCIPYEVLVRRFTASYSASRAAIELAWAAFKMMRSWFVDEYAQPIYEWMLVDAILTGKLAAPGFFTDPLVRLAYSSCEWVGPTAPQIDPLKDVQAADARIKAQLSTHQRETALLTGQDWTDTIAQLGKEKEQMKGAGVTAEPVPPPLSAPAVPPVDNATGSDLETAAPSPAGAPE